MKDKGRPLPLFPLFAGIETLDGVGPGTARALAGIGVEVPRDLLFTLPHAGVDRRLRNGLQGITLPATVTLAVTVGAHAAPKQRGRPYRISVLANGTDMTLVYFHARAEHLLNLLPPGKVRIVSGRAELFDGIAQIVHPDHVLRPEEAAALPAYEPVYPAGAGLTQRIMAKSVAGALARVPVLDEWIDGALRAREGWPAWNAALTAAHHPQGGGDLAPGHPARARLAYDEFFAHQLMLALVRRAQRRGKGRPAAGDGRLRSRVLAKLPYAPTSAQTRAVAEIEADMASAARMSRLLQGDVGSGKTLVALLALLIAVEAGGQGVLMAPTEILARQHHDGLRAMADAAGITLDVLSGRDKGAVRSEKLARLASGETAILVGTHAVFQKGVDFADLRLAVIDEQHRFGVAQRMELGAKGAAVDVLVMTATPIPRSLSLAQYGDMDLSVLDEKPPGRSPIRTALMPNDRLEDVVDHLRAAVGEGRQAYWVCPLVEESDVLDLTAAEARFAHLRAALGEGLVGLVHGQLPPAAKDAAMARFQSGQTRVLVATTVIEVGVNVPDASIMVIEQAEIFGLAQLHQLRGRVGRGAVRSTCLMLYQPPLGEAAQRRLSILRETEDGFRIAEEDLAIRGAGDVLGVAQSGLPRFRIADPERQTALMALAQTDARSLLVQDPALDSPRGRAARVLLWLMGQDRAYSLMAAG